GQRQKDFSDPSPTGQDLQTALAFSGCRPQNTARPDGPERPAPRGRSTMRIGMNLLLWTAHVTQEHFPLLEKLKKAGFDGVELPLFQGDVAHYRPVRQQLSNLGLGCTTVTVVDAQTNPVSPDAAVRRASLDRIKWAIEMTATLGGSHLVGPYHSALG